jgi:membrane-associated phospholipid phosphatase
MRRLRGDVPPALNDADTRINAVDVLNVAAILLLAVAVAFYRRQLGEAALWLLGIFASLFLFTLLAAMLSSRHVIWRTAHDFFPVLTVPVLFNTLGPIIESATPIRWDATLAAVDARLFGALPAVWRATLGRPAWFTDAAYLAYTGYYVAPVALGAMLYQQHPRSEFRCFVFTMVLAFYAAYLGYCLFPTVGPRPPQELEPAVIGGGPLSEAVRSFISFAERTRTDAFPSGHTAGALICLYFARQRAPAIFGMFAAVATGIVFSTVYLHYHYVIDVVAGVVLAGACGWLGPRLEPLLEPRQVMKKLTVRSDAR